MLRRGVCRGDGFLRGTAAQQAGGKDTNAKQQCSRYIAASALAASQHAGWQHTISPAFSRVSVGNADEAIAALFFGADIPHVIINTELWKDNVKYRLIITS